MQNIFPPNTSAYLSYNETIFKVHLKQSKKKKRKNNNRKLLLWRHEKASKVIHAEKLHIGIFILKIIYTLMRIIKISQKTKIY